MRLEKEKKWKENANDTPDTIREHINIQPNHNRYGPHAKDTDQIIIPVSSIFRWIVRWFKNKR